MPRPLKQPKYRPWQIDLAEEILHYMRSTSLSRTLCCLRLASQGAIPLGGSSFCVPYQVLSRGLFMCPKRIPPFGRLLSTFATFVLTENQPKVGEINISGYYHHWHLYCW